MQYVPLVLAFGNKCRPIALEQGGVLPHYEKHTTAVIGAIASRDGMRFSIVWWRWGNWPPARAQACKDHDDGTSDARKLIKTVGSYRAKLNRAVVKL